MRFNNHELMAPVFDTPQGRWNDHRAPVVSLVPSGGPVESGVRLYLNRPGWGYQLDESAEGFTVAPVSVVSADLASGGSVFRHARLESSDMFLPVHLHTPVPSTLPQMFDRLVQIVQPGRKRFFDVVVFDPYSLETRTRKVMATEVTDPTRHNDWWWTVGITAQFFDPFWYGQVRELRRTLGSVDKKFITAKPDPGGYEFPFFPVRIGGSVVQGEYELQVEGDAPAYWSGVITPPGEDLLIQNAAGERIFVQGRVDEPILIQTRPQEQDITLAAGTPIWDRIDPGDDDFFPLHPGQNTVHVSMVGATQQSEILIRYREAFFHSLGGGR